MGGLVNRLSCESIDAISGVIVFLYAFLDGRVPLSIIC